MYQGMTDALDVTDAAQAPGPQKAPFPYFGGKSRVADEVWTRFGNVHTYVEPFGGSLAVLLARPAAHAWWTRRETAGDYSGLVVNFFRAVSQDPDAVAAAASWPVTEIDLAARHLYLVRYADDLAEAMAADPLHYDVQAAGWWVWGVSAWVGGEWCSGLGPFHPGTDTGPGVYRKMPMAAGNHHGKGIHRIQPGTPGTAADGTPLIADLYQERLTAQFRTLAQRLHRVRLIAGDWTRMTRSIVEPVKGETAGIFLDPPYDSTLRRANLYGPSDTGHSGGAQIHDAVRDWALSIGDAERYRIAYCTYSTPEEDAVMHSAGWFPYRWTAAGGYGLQSENRARENKDREVIWFSPHCLHPEGDVLFHHAEGEVP